uniref:Uncharacterized protein n=1 Tax=Arundo donax TaxID=35708 RepID=A0A0A9G5V8_ARUDO
MYVCMYVCIHTHTYVAISFFCSIVHPSLIIRINYIEP